MAKFGVSAFKAYDIRGVVPDELDATIAYRIGRAFAQYVKAKRVVVGHDIRLSSPELSKAVMRGLAEGGVEDVIDIGMCGTEMIYFSTPHFDADGGIMITASHNPKQYNGMKFVRRGSVPISGDTGLNDIRDLVASADFVPSKDEGAWKSRVRVEDVYADYAKHIASFLDLKALKPIKVVCNAGNGIGGRMAEAIAKYLPFELVKLNFEPDGNFPNGVPNPLLPENRDATSKAVIENHADLGVAWDGDSDRCFLFDEKGGFAEGYYIVGLLAKAFLSRDSHARIIHDPRLTWNTIEIVKSMGGTPIMSKTGHAFIKERMRREDAVYGGEMSAHHYFRDFFYCDSGMLPWLLVAEQICSSGKILSSMLEESERRYPVSGEINSKVKDAAAVLRKVEDAYKDKALSVDHTDGVSMDMGRWRFNVRMSNTEPVVRLNVESKGDKALTDEKTKELLGLIRA